MTVIDSRGHLAKDAPSLVLGEDLALAEVVVELAAGGVLHHQHHLLFVLEHFVDVDDVGMLHRRHDLDLAPDAHQIGLRFDFGLLDGLDGHLEADLVVKR